jgi:hypothetical protein
MRGRIVKITYICSWCGVDVEPNYDHVEQKLGDAAPFTPLGDRPRHALDCKGTFSHPGSGSCRRRFTDLGHHQVSEKHGPS